MEIEFQLCFCDVFITQNKVFIAVTMAVSIPFNFRYYFDLIKSRWLSEKTTRCSLILTTGKI